MKRILENTLAEEAHCHSRCCAFMFFLFGCLARFTPTQNCRGVTYSRPNPGTGMPSQERFRARPMWACLEPCPVSKITSFGLDSSRSRKSVVVLVYMVSFPTGPIASQTVMPGKRILEGIPAPQMDADGPGALWPRRGFPMANGNRPTIGANDKAPTGEGNGKSPMDEGRGRRGWPGALWARLR